MHTAIVGLTVLLVALFAWKAFGPKGTKGHITRGFAIFGTSAALVALVVALIFEQGVDWTAPLLIHASLGLQFLFSLFAALISGFLLSRGKNSAKKYHRWAAYSTGIFLVLAIVSAFFINN